MTQKPSPLPMTIDRRHCLGAGLLAAAAIAGRFGHAQENAAAHQPTWSAPDKRRIYKTLKLNMVKDGRTLREKFQLAADAGFHGIEVDSPGHDTAELIAASQAASLPIDGTVCAGHWQVRHTDPDPQVRAAALKSLQEAIEQTHAIGGHSVLLVIGHAKDAADGNPQKLIDMAAENIVPAVATAAYYGVSILVENVWNGLMYTDNGPSDQSPQAFIDFIDRFDSPWIGMQFDIGNHWKYADVAAWIRQLDRRIFKLDIKDFSRAQSQFVDLGQGDIPWPDVAAALRDIDYRGWCAAELRGGDAAYLRSVSDGIDRLLELA